MTIKIEPIDESHIEAFHAALDIVARERKYLSFVEAPSIEIVRKFVVGNISSNVVQVVALDDQRVVGWCDICPHSQVVHAHCGTLGIGVLPEYRGKGIGKKLILTALELAKNSGIERVDLSVYTTNVRAVNLYLSEGFLVEGTKKKAAKINGEYVDQYIMALIF